MTALRREGADPVRKGRPWSLPLEDRVLLVLAYWRTNLTMRQLAPLFGISKSAAGRIIDHLGPALALRPRRRFSKDTVQPLVAPTGHRALHRIVGQHLRPQRRRQILDHQVLIEESPRTAQREHQAQHGSRDHELMFGCSLVAVAYVTAFYLSSADGALLSTDALAHSSPFSVKPYAGEFLPRQDDRKPKEMLPSAGTDRL